MLLRFKVFKAMVSAVLPFMPMLGIVVLLGYSFVAATVYSDLLSDTSSRKIKYMYIALLGSIYTPVGILISNYFDSFYYISLICVAIFSEYFVRKCLTYGRQFESEDQKWNFIMVSIVMNFGFYVFIFPLFFSH